MGTFSANGAFSDSQLLSARSVWCAACLSTVFACVILPGCRANAQAQASILSRLRRRLALAASGDIFPQFIGGLKWGWAS